MADKSPDQALDFLKNHPAYVASLAWAALAWQSLLYETYFLSKFGITPIEYAELSNFFTIAFRRPEAAAIYPPVFLLAWLGARSGSKNRQHAAIIAVLVILLVFTVQSVGAARSGAMRGAEILSLTIDDLSETELNRLVRVRLELGGSDSLPKSATHLIYLSRLGDSVFLYDVLSSSVFIVPKSKISYLISEQVERKNVRRVSLWKFPVNVPMEGLTCRWKGKAEIVILLRDLKARVYE